MTTEELECSNIGRERDPRKFLLFWVCLVYSTLVLEFATVYGIVRIVRAIWKL